MDSRGHAHAKRRPARRGPRPQREARGRRSGRRERGDRDVERGAVLARDQLRLRGDARQHVVARSTAPRSACPRRTRGRGDRRRASRARPRRSPPARAAASRPTVSDIISRKRFATVGTISILPPPNHCMNLPPVAVIASIAWPSTATASLSTGWSLFAATNVADVLAERLDVRAAALHQLAADEVHRLDVVRALVDREDLRVAAVLLDRLVLEVAGAAVDLDRGRADRGTPDRCRTP